MDESSNNDCCVLVEPDGTDDANLCLAVHSDGTITNGDGSAAQRLYPTTDANYDVTALVNTSGSIVELYQYDPYGTVTVLNPDWSAHSGNVSTVGWVYLFQGGRYDAATALYDFRHRELDPQLGGWLSIDPLGDLGVGKYRANSNLVATFAVPSSEDSAVVAQNTTAKYSSGMDLYLYEGGHPLNFVDPLGLDAISDCRSAPPMTCNVKNPYPPDYTYLGIDADMMFRFGGSNDWANLVRGCLACMYSHGVNADTAHNNCYSAAAHKVGFWYGFGGYAEAVGVATLIGIGKITYKISTLWGNEISAR